MVIPPHAIQSSQILGWIKFIFNSETKALNNNNKNVEKKIGHDKNERNTIQ